MKTIYFIVFLIIATSCSNKKSGEILELKKTNRELTDELFIKSEIERTYLAVFHRTIMYCNSPIANTRVFWGRDSLNTFELSQIASKPRLVFCFSANTCTPCIEMALELTKGFFPDFLENENIIITGDYPMRLRNDCYGKKMLTGVVLPLKEIEVPFFFILDKNMNLSFLHLFNKANSDYTKLYLDEIRKKYNF